MQKPARKQGRIGYARNALAYARASAPGERPERRMHDEIPIAGFVEKLRLFAGRLHGIVIEGDSMTPTLKTGDRVLVAKDSVINVGDIVVARHPFKSSVKILKRVSSIETDENISLIGDNPNESSDSRGFGSIKRTDVIGKVVARLT
jgi:nickel-type superoxide dismutase maturation protease